MMFSLRSGRYQDEPKQQALESPSYDRELRIDLAEAQTLRLRSAPSRDTLQGRIFSLSSSTSLRGHEDIMSD